jgi:SAM-dependent methyltransferase
MDQALPAVPTAADRPARASTWFFWHAHRIRPGMKVLDLAAGAGRHAIAAAELGAEVTALELDAATIARGEAAAAERKVQVAWRETDLTKPWPELGVFDVVLCFNYLDRARVHEVVARVAPGGMLMMETFLVAQRHLGWGPQSDDHLLRPGELNGLVAPLAAVHGREVVEPLEGERWRAIASVLAERRSGGPT